MESEGLGLDIISNLPQNVIETILCLLPIQDAVRTSILSKKWRYNWVRIPKLVFVEKDMFYEHLEPWLQGRSTKRKQLTGICKVFYAIHQVLLLHQGPIIGFTLSMEADHTCVEIDQIILHLSRKNTLKNLTLDFTFGDDCYHLPSSVFLLHQLTYLYLCNCVFYAKQTLSGFSCLTSLCLNNVKTSLKMVVYLLSKSPLLKNFSLVSGDGDFTVGEDGLCFKLFEYLPMIEYLTFGLWFTEDPGDRYPLELPTALVHLKYLCLEHMSFLHKLDRSYLVLLIRSSPNLQKLKLMMFKGNLGDSQSVALHDYLDIWLEHLKEFEIGDFRNLDPELDFLKFILVKSPVLKTVRILLHKQVTQDEEVKMLRFLLRCPRASLVEIIVECRPNS